MQYTVGMFAEDDWRILPSLNLGLGVRLDAIHTGEGGTVEEEHVQTDVAASGHLGLSIHMSERTRLVFNAARAFRAPTLRERYLDTITCLGMVCGHADLEPETSLNLDLGFKGEPGHARFEVYAFSSWIQDLITARTGEAATGEGCDYAYSNTARAWLMGGEGQVHLDIPLHEDLVHLVPGVSASYVRGQDMLNAEPLPQTRVSPFGTTALACL